jgi:hypothetical protein
MNVNPPPPSISRGNQVMDELVRRVVERSMLFRALDTAGDRLAAAAAEARAVAAFRKRLDQLRRLELRVRIRCLGCLILSAAVTYAGLAVLLPHDTPANGSRALVALIAASGAFAIWSAPHLATAWRAR